ncbi:MAG: adenosylcobalamin-dependent ribonucleoside-diphosphate reductase [Desulfobacteraceae bacterium]|nr:adenosylcobalamin-dependent ribonucleoside-diphosphate reductase [Desulfobacteraceae bacterium]
MSNLELTPAARAVMEKRYLARDNAGNLIETPGQLFHRVARAVAEADRMLDPGSSVKKTADDFEAAMTSFAFLPNTPCLVNAGRPMGQLAACFVLPVEDNLESIFQTLKDTALIHQSGGGTGFSFSRIRPRGDTIFPAFGVSGGPVSFIELFDSATHIIDRNQVRPGANMGVLHVSHPDIEEFILAKTGQGRLQNFNLSVAVDDRFLKSLENRSNYPLIHSRTGTKVGEKPADRIMDIIAESAWECGDPGILFIDRINRDNPTPGMGGIEATNPCGEQPLLPFESCTLGSINLTRFVSNNGIDYSSLEQTVELGVHFLDNVIEVNRYPLRQIEEWSRTNRKIGLGVMGFADALIMMGVPYQSQKALNLAEEIMDCIRKTAAAASARLAEKRGNFPAFEHSNMAASGIKKRRNASLTTIAPTGTISLLAGVSSGIEPVFSFELKRRVIDEVIDEIHPVYRRYVEEGRTPPKEIFQTAWDVAPDWHLKIQEAFQKHTDNAVSKTVNFRADATVNDIRELFDTASHMELKGVTVYRDRSRPDQSLSADPVRCEKCA